MASACCLAWVRLLRLGQSMLATVDTQAARNSRGAGGGMLGSTGCAAGGVPSGRGAAPGASGAGAVGVLEQASSSAATTPATPADKVSRFFALNLPNTKTIPRFS